jgi:hypothetical protein
VDMPVLRSRWALHQPSGRIARRAEAENMFFLAPTSERLQRLGTCTSVSVSFTSLSIQMVNRDSAIIDLLK